MQNTKNNQCNYTKLETTIIRLAGEIQSYCLDNNDQPKEVSKPKSTKELTSRRLYRWLRKSYYSPENNKFKYNYLLFPDGSSVKNFLDQLYKKYYKENIRSNEHVIALVSEIIKYCIKYNNWPYQARQSTEEQDLLSTKLSCWLMHSYYYKDEEFKYKDILFTPNLRVKDVLDFFFLSYGGKNSRINYYKKLAAEIEVDKILALYNIIVKLDASISTSFEEYDYYYNLLRQMLNDLNIGLTLENILELLRLPHGFRQYEFEKWYAIHSIANNNELAYLFHLLYLNSTITNECLKRERKL